MGLYDNNLFYLGLCVMVFALQRIWLSLPKNSEIKHCILLDDKFCEFFFCCCISLSVASLFRLFPGNNRIPAEDSSVFLYIGRRMTEGKIPYRDLFDHKGPILYLIEYLGALCSPNSFSGIWVLEVLNLFFTAKLMCRLGRELSYDRPCVFLAVMLSLGVCGWKVWQGGNFTEEYALPWITLAACVFFSFIQTGSYHGRDVVLLGVGFAIVFLLRANMVLAWVAFVPAVILILAIKGRWSEIGKCTLWFSAGMLAVLLPILICLQVLDSLKAFWETYFLFNFLYTANASSGAGQIRTAIYFSRVLWPGTLAALACLFAEPKQKIHWWNALFIAVSLFAAGMSGRGYYHYAIIILPAIVLPLTAVFSLMERWMVGKEQNRKTVSPLVMIVSFMLILIAAFSYRLMSSREEEIDPVAQYLQSNTEKSDDVLVLGNHCCSYLQSDRITENRFFYQLPPLEISDDLYTAFIEELSVHPSEVVVLPGTEDERSEIDIALRGLRKTLLARGYHNDIYEEFEVFCR